MVFDADGQSGPRIVQWFLDTRSLWPIPSSQSGTKDEVQQLKTVASRELDLLTESERSSVLKFYHLRDAKMSLASHLLKHFVIAKYCNVPWLQTTVSRDSKGKPCFIPSTHEERKVDFNVSHQAGIVSLIAAVGFKEMVDVGTDIVCWNERAEHDYAHIDKHGLFDWVDMHADVFADTEIKYMKFGSLELEFKDDVARDYGKDAISRCERRGGSLEISVKEDEGERKIRLDRDTIVDAKLRRFYAMWCLREAYVKMTGDALLAPWLKELEISDVRPPRAKEDVKDDESLEEGEILKHFRLFFKGKEVLDVDMEIVAIGANFMIGGSVRRELGVAKDSTLKMGRWRPLNLEDILEIAEGQV